MNYPYTEEKLIEAVYSLAAGDGDARSRLYQAYLKFHVLTTDSFPEELKADWNWVILRITEKGPLKDNHHNNTLGSVQNTLNGIKNKTASKIASKIIDIFFALQNHH